MKNVVFIMVAMLASAGTMAQSKDDVRDTVVTDTTVWKSLGETSDRYLFHSHLYPPLY
jgi:predicted dinucleotide-binding enzyme